jgi:hypothetical protein
MKRLLIFLLLVFPPLLVRGQVDSSKFFNNVNNELCIFLYESSDPIGPYRVFMVVEEMEKEEIELVFKQAKSNNLAVVQRWALEGKRIEIERYPYITYAPKFPSDRKFPDLQPTRPTQGKSNWGETKDRYGIDQSFR